MIYNLVKMNLILYGVDVEEMNFCNGDMLNKDWLIDEFYIFDVVVMNLFYLVNWLVDMIFLDDFWFNCYGKLVLKFKVDFVFFFYGFYYLKEIGIMVIVLLYGVLFCGVVEGVIC